MKTQTVSTLRDAIRKAQFGHKDWIAWTRPDGSFIAYRKSPESVKMCLLEKGTQGRWYIVSANDGCLLGGAWWIGINLLAHMKRGYY